MKYLNPLKFEDIKNNVAIPEIKESFSVMINQDILYMILVSIVFGLIASFVYDAIFKITNSKEVSFIFIGVFIMLVRKINF